MSWIKRKERVGEGTEKTEGLWVKCNACKEIIYRKELERQGKVCPKCQYHFPISLEERISLVVDNDSFKPYDASLSPLDPLQFKDKLKYKERLKTAQETVGSFDAVMTGECRINHRLVVLGMLDFTFMGGSMGSVVGEKITRAVERAIEREYPFLFFSASGGARMQEGIFSLMQMAKTSAVIARLKRTKVPYFSILTDPTYGGVTASFAMLGDVILAEPKALIGFAGPRVIERTIGEQLPVGFQRAEFLLEHGMIDMIVERKHLRETLIRLLSYF